MNLDGLLVVDKPQGWSSFDVVAKVRGTLKRETGKKIKVGHTGTLDPLATGLMIIVIGSYCKRAAEFSKLDKTYEVITKLGVTSTTGDEEGEKKVTSSTQPEEAEIAYVLKSFEGDSMQVPPIFSAIKIDGKRAYKMAREGKTVEMQPRPVHISNIELTNYNYPCVMFTADVGSGTYIRSLVQDIGEKLQTGAYMTDLRRTIVGDFTLSNSVKLDDIDYQQITAHLQTTDDKA